MSEDQTVAAPGPPLGDDSKTLAIILGAHAWPDMPSLPASNAFERSASAFKNYLRSNDGLNLPESCIKDLFDSELSRDQLDIEIWEFLKKHCSEEVPNFTDVIIYYTGHGDFTRGEQKFQLMLRSTNYLNSDFSGYTMRQLATIVNAAARKARKLVILDCCYAAAAFKDWQMQGVDDIKKAISLQAADNFSGTALICACDAHNWALFDDNDLTMFSGGLMRSLHQGDMEGGDWLSIGDIYKLTRAEILSRNESDGVAPLLHVPKGRQEEMTSYPLFPNPARRVDATRVAEARRNVGFYRDQGRGGLAQDEREAARLFTSRRERNRPELPSAGLSSAQALYDKAIRLTPSEEAIAVYDGLLTRFGTATESPLRELIADALVNKGTTLGLFGRSKEAIAVYDDLITRFGTATESPLRERVAEALYYKGAMLRGEEAIAVYDDLITRFGTATAASRETQRQADVALHPVERAFGRESPLRELVAHALVKKGLALRIVGRSEEAMAVYDDLITRFGTATELPMRERVAEALDYKGAMLGTPGCWEEAIATYDVLITRFGTATELPLRERVAKALVNKGITLRIVGRSEEAIAVYDDLITRFGTATELPLRKQVAKALDYKGAMLGTPGCWEEAIATYDVLITRFGTATELPLREGVAHALVNKGLALRMLSRSQEAIAVYDDLITRFGTATESPLRELVAKARGLKCRLRKS